MTARRGINLHSAFTPVAPWVLGTSPRMTLLIVFDALPCQPSLSVSPVNQEHTLSKRSMRHSKFTR